MRISRPLSVMPLAVLIAAGSLVASSDSQDKQPPQVQIPKPGVPQIMTLEANFVRAAYNNEGYVILGYQLANRSVGGPLMVLDIGVTVGDGVRSYKLTRADVSLETPDGATIPMLSTEYKSIKKQVDAAFKTKR